MSDPELSIRIATVNGTGSATANSILGWSFLKSGLKFTSKNIFPSNIQGSPTWFNFRIYKGFPKGFVEKGDILIALNLTTLRQDLESVNDSGLLIVDEPPSLAKAPDAFSKPNLPSWLIERAAEKSLTLLSIPFKSILEELKAPIKAKKYLYNMIYVGVVCEIFNLETDVIQKAVEHEVKLSGEALELNLKVIERGRQAWRQFISQNEEQVPVFKRLKTNNFFREQSVSGEESVSQKIWIDGNTAGALGMLMGGATFCAWYPITPSSSLVEEFQKLTSRYRKSPSGNSQVAILQAEDEIASICMALGAGWSGARAFTATSGPGLSLMQEAAGYAYYSDIPLVVWDVQRVGPSTGMPTRTSQGDIMLAAFSSHGDTRFPIYFPGNPEECFLFAQESLDLAEELQTLVYILSDLDIGMNRWIQDEFKYPRKPYQRGKIVTAEDLRELEKTGQAFKRYDDPEKDGIPPRPLPGTRHPSAGFLTRGSGHTISGTYTESGAEYLKVLERLDRKWNTAREKLPKPVQRLFGSKAGLILYGSASMIEPEIGHLLDQKKIKMDHLRIRAFPFSQEVRSFVETHDKIFVIDLNHLGQMSQLLRMEYPEFAQKIELVSVFNGLPISAQDVVSRIETLA